MARAGAGAVRPMCRRMSRPMRRPGTIARRKSWIAGPDANNHPLKGFIILPFGNPYNAN